MQGTWLLLRCLTSGLLLLLVLSGSPTPAAAATRYSSEGFEYFSQGSIEDQDSWGVVGAYGDAVIQSGIAASGSRSLALNIPAEASYAYRLDEWSPCEAGLEAVTLRARIRPEPGSGWRWIYFYNNHDRGEGVVANLGDGRVYGYQVPGGELSPLGLGTHVPRQWGEITVTIDYKTQEYEVTWDAATTGRQRLEGSTLVSQFAGWSLGGEGGPTGMYVDDLTVTAERSPVLPDVRCDYWAWWEILACLDAGVVGGFPDGTYQPTLPVTRDQMAAYISRALAGGDANVPAGPDTASFADVAKDHWAFRYVEYARARNIVTGYPDGTYGPSAALDRAQMAVFVARAMASPTGEEGLRGYTPPATPSFPDVAATFWAHKYVEYIAEAAVATGYPDGLYHPESVCTRDQMAVYVARAFGLAS